MLKNTSYILFGLDLSKLWTSKVYWPRADGSVDQRGRGNGCTNEEAGTTMVQTSVDNGRPHKGSLNEVVRQEAWQRAW
jgi:hypothetical protein